jgi:RNA polymerase sigma factor (sigma-70 family)
VRRHGALVLGVCRRVLRHDQDAEDAFQATFVVLARHAGAVARPEALGNWLYGVAYNVARKARTARARRAAHETAAATAPRPDPAPEPDADLAQLIDAELAALAEKYRSAVVLCDLGGLTAQQAADALGCPAKTLGTRLRRGREQLAARLARRGLGAAAAALAIALPECATAASPELVARAAETALAEPAAVPVAIAALTDGVLPTMTGSAFKYAALACALAACGFGARPLMAYLHAPRPAPGGGARAARPAPPAPDRAAFERFHDFLLDLLPWDVRFKPADDKKDEKPQPPAGLWQKDGGETALEFGEGKLTIFPHGKEKKVAVVCSFELEKGTVKAKVTGYEGSEQAKKAFAEKLPVGTEFAFRWTPKKDAATVSDVNGEKIEPFASVLEGDFAKK